jgi:hypothetical protein
VLTTTRQGYGSRVAFTTGVWSARLEEPCTAERVPETATGPTETPASCRSVAEVSFANGGFVARTRFGVFGQAMSRYGSRTLRRGFSQPELYQFAPTSTPSTRRDRIRTEVSVPQEHAANHQHLGVLMDSDRRLRGIWASTVTVTVTGQYEQDDTRRTTDQLKGCSLPSTSRIIRTIRHSTNTDPLSENHGVPGSNPGPATP